MEQQADTEVAASDFDCESRTASRVDEAKERITEVDQRRSMNGDNPPSTLLPMEAVASDTGSSSLR
jgi:hypothetical protein